VKLRLEQLESHLARQLLPVYLISGDEPLQVMETMDQLRTAARQQDYSIREVLEAGRDFNWSSLSASAASMSLFGDKRILECRLGTTKPGRDGGAALIQYCEQPAEDTLLLIEMGKLDKASQNTKWFKALEKIGAFIQIWPVGHQQLPAWVKRRADQKGLALPHDAATLIAERVEGNLLAAAQEIEKLGLLFLNKAESGQSIKLSTEDVIRAVADSARYSVYDLTDAAVSGDKNRVIKILHGLAGEGVAPTLVLWSLSNEIRNLLKFRHQLDSGKSPATVFNAVWQNRRPMVQGAVKRLSLIRLTRLLKQAAKADRIIKGFEKGLVWETLMSLALGLSR